MTRRNTMKRRARVKDLFNNQNASIKQMADMFCKSERVIRRDLQSDQLHFHKDDKKKVNSTNK